MTPYTLHPGTTILLEPRYYGSIAWYAAMAAHEHVIVDYDARFDKRHKLTHRTTIADVNGRLDLTVPLAKSTSLPGQPLRWRDMTLSAHGDWWNVHRIAMESAYGRTPYFEFYIDRFKPALMPDAVERFVTLGAIDRFIDGRVRELLDLPQDSATPSGTVMDYRHHEPPLPPLQPYYQIRSSRLGFIPGLSIMDLLFNMGPEAKLWLRNTLLSSISK